MKVESAVEFIKRYKTQKYHSLKDIIIMFKFIDISRKLEKNGQIN